MNNNDVKLSDIDANLIENSFAEKKSKDLGLKHSGFGYFINEDGKIVAFSGNNGTRLIIVEESKNKQFIKGPSTDAGTARYYFADNKGEIHLTTMNYGTRQNWGPASRDQAKSFTSSQSKNKAAGSLTKGAIKKPVTKDVKKKAAEKKQERPQRRGESKHKSKEVKAKANEIVNLEKPIPPEALKKEAVKKQFLNTMVGAILQDPDTGKGAGKYTLSREDLDTYKSYLEGNTPEIPKYNVSDEDVDKVIDIVKSEMGSKGYSAFMAKMARKGDPPKGMANVARGRAVIQDYIMKGGISSITGKFVPFSESQLDHRVSLDNGGYDGGGNWDWMEARFNQFKGALTDDAVMAKIKKELSKSPDEAKLKKLQSAYKNFVRNSYKDYFKKHGHDSISAEDVAEASGDDGLAMLKAMSDAFGVARYADSGMRASGRKGGGKFIGAPALKKKLIESLGLKSREEIQKEDQILASLIKQTKEKGEEISSLKKDISARKKAAKKAAMK